MAESEILQGGQWDPRRFRADGAVHVEIMGPDGMPLRLEVDGLQAQLRRQSSTGGAFAVQGAREGVTLFASTEQDAAFPGGAMIDLSLSFPSARRDYLVERVDISGHRRAPLVRIAAEDDQWVLSPVDVAPAAEPIGFGAPDGPDPEPRASAGWSAGPSHETVPEMLGAWIGRRRSDRGAAVLPSIGEIRIDRSASMAPRAKRAGILHDLVLALARAGGGPLPAVVESSVGGTTRNGVGSAALDSAHRRDSTDRTLLITDVPVSAEGTANLVIGDPEILEVLHSDDAYAVPADAWQELEREDSRFDDATLRRLEALIDWLTRTAPAEEARR